MVLDLAQRWELNSMSKNESDNQQFRLNVEASASNTIWRVMIGLIIAVVTGLGSVGYNNVQGKLDNFGVAMQALEKRDKDHTQLLIEVKLGIEEAAKSAKEPVKSKLLRVSKKIDDHLKQSENLAEQKVDQKQSQNKQLSGGDGTPPIRN